MLRNYFITAIRNILRNKTFSLINLTGLAAGLACFILIFLWVSDELSYDRFFPNAGRIYCVNFKDDREGKSLTQWRTPPILSKAMKFSSGL